MRDALSEKPDAGRSEFVSPVRGHFQQYHYLVPATGTLYVMTGARSTRE